MSSLRHSMNRTTSTEDRYFLITMTNFPNLLERTQQHQPRLNQCEQAAQHGAMLRPNVHVHLGTIDSDDHETLLYNTLTFELKEAIRAYLHRTQRAYPINLVLDMSGIEPSH